MSEKNMATPIAAARRITIPHTIAGAIETLSDITYVDEVSESGLFYIMNPTNNPDPEDPDMQPCPVFTDVPRINSITAAFPVIGTRVS